MSTITDSFARAQARFDTSEHPDFWLDDRAEAFAEAVAEECARQLAVCDEMHASFIADKIRGQHIKLMRDPAAFTNVCGELVQAGAAEFLPSLIEQAMAMADWPKFRGCDISYIVECALMMYTDPLPVPCEVGP